MLRATPVSSGGFWSCGAERQVTRVVGRIGDGAFAVAAAFLLAGAAASQNAASEAKPADPQGAKSESKVEATGKAAGQIATQPARDVGVAKTKIPPTLARAREDPYSLEGMKGCQQLALAITELNDVLGPDFVVGSEKRENRAGKVAEAGGKTIINAFIPFRGLVREISGAAPAQRRLDEAVRAGYARRGFLRGVHQARGCP